MIESRAYNILIYRKRLMNIQELEVICTAMKKHGYSSFELTNRDKTSLKIKLDTTIKEVGACEDFLAPEEFEQDESEVTQVEIRCEKVGTFTFANPLKVGDSIRKGETLGYVKGIGFKDKINCSLDGTISKLAVKDGTVVDYGKLLMVVDLPH